MFYIHAANCFTIISQLDFYFCCLLSQLRIEKKNHRKPLCFSVIWVAKQRRRKKKNKCNMQFFVAISVLLAGRLTIFFSHLVFSNALGIAVWRLSVNNSFLLTIYCIELIDCKLFFSRHRVQKVSVGSTLAIGSFLGGLANLFTPSSGCTVLVEVPLVTYHPYYKAELFGSLTEKLNANQDRFDRDLHQGKCARI